MDDHAVTHNIVSVPWVRRQDARCCHSCLTDIILGVLSVWWSVWSIFQCSLVTFLGLCRCCCFVFVVVLSCCFCYHVVTTVMTTVCVCVVLPHGLPATREQTVAFHYPSSSNFSLKKAFPNNNSPFFRFFHKSYHCSWLSATLPIF
jgi:hypothetical protein